MELSDLTSKGAKSVLTRVFPRNIIVRRSSRGGFRLLAKIGPTSISEMILIPSSPSRRTMQGGNLPDGISLGMSHGPLPHERYIMSPSSRESIKLSIKATNPAPVAPSLTNEDAPAWGAPTGMYAYICLSIHARPFLSKQKLRK